jgi:hypothetical protein
MEQNIHAASQRTPWNKVKVVGQKTPLKLKEIWAIRVRLQIARRVRFGRWLLDASGWASTGHEQTLTPDRESPSTALIFRADQFSARQNQ